MFFCARIQMKIMVILPDRGKPLVKINQILTRNFSQGLCKLVVSIDEC